MRYFVLPFILFQAKFDLFSIFSDF